MEKLKLAIISDIHINSWYCFSTIDSEGVPSRLKIYEKLAEDFSKYSHVNNCDLNIISGDLAEKPTNDPETNYYIRKFLEIVSKDKKTIIINGNHDINAKLNSYEVNSILSSLSGNIPNLIYVNDTECFEEKGIKIVAKSWDKNCSIPIEWMNNYSIKDVDIFIGHGVVSGSSNFDNYIFQNGFKTEDLFSNFRLSIIGDIHNHQVFYSNDKSRVVLVPGATPPATFKDSPNSYFHTVEIDKNNIKLEKTSIYDFSPNTYHRFLFVNDESEIKETNGLVHYRIKSFSSKNPKQKREELISNIIDINKVFNEFINNKELPNKDKIKELFSKYFSTNDLKNDYYIPNVEILELKINNFLSIDNFEINFKKLLDQTIILGNTGSGKTSVLDALYYAITGETSKNISVDNLINKSFSDKKSFSVELELLVNNKRYKIKRGRVNDKPDLVVYSESENGEFLPFNKISVKDTQDHIYKLLNLNDFDIKLFSYYSSKNPVLFNGLKDSEKFSVISKILRLFDLDNIREKIKLNRGKLSSSLMEKVGELKILNSNIESINSKLISYSSQNVSELKEQVLSSINEINKKREVLVSKNNKDVDIEKIRKESEDYSNKLKALDKEYFVKKNEKSSLSVLLLKLKTDYKNLLKSGKCYACNQNLSDENLKVSLEKEIREAAKKLLEYNLESYEESISSLNKKCGELSSLINSYYNYQQATNALDKEENLAQQRLNSLSDNTSYINELKKDKIDTEKQLKTVKEEYNTVNNDIECDNYLLNTLLKKDGDFIKELNYSVVKIIQNEIDNLLSDKNISIKIDKNLNVVSNFNGESLNYENLSNGQSRICDLILLISFNNVFSKLYNINGVLGVSMFDETLSFLSPEFIDISKSLLDKLVCNKLFVITHDSRLQSMFDGKIMVGMKNGISNYEILN